ncbi:uncharacterized protein LOC105793225 [Gossypium raimondii]|uniref:uncharacterized protein LOC105793225 n=1 Tax=Gossypium raimondii TaxID=29730 RepID=UPI00063AD589|nr:uncharacterized protein LOC105793225 [Gossypium raimondii]
MEESIEERLENVHINAIHEDTNEEGTMLDIHPYEPGSSLNNWTVEEIPEVFRAFSDIKEEENDDHPQYRDILRYVKNCEYPNQATENDKRTLRRLTIDYILYGEILYKRGKDRVLLRCVNAVEANKILEEVHESICGTHVNGFTMVEAASYANVTKRPKRFRSCTLELQWERIVKEPDLILSGRKMVQILCLKGTVD